MQPTPNMSHSQESKEATFMYELEHHAQQLTWDCGLSCICMLLPSDGANDLQNNMNVICAEEYQNQSTWTIDLCYILKHFSINHKFCTKTIGVDQTFVSENFYSNTLRMNEDRVNKRFQTAASAGITIENVVLELNILLNHLELHGPAIVLINGSIINCSDCISLGDYLETCINSFFKRKQSYSGHYIVLSGFDREKQLIYFKDPSVRKELCWISFSDFDKARHSYGTDDDIILIYGEYKQGKIVK